MGHLTLISEDVISALEHYPPDLRFSIAQFAPQPAWDEYVTGRYDETKKKDTILLGGGKPAVAPGAPRNGTRWKVDEEDAGTPAPTIGSSRLSTNGVSEMKGEFRRAAGAHPVRESSADFKLTSMDEEEEDVSSPGPPQVSHCLHSTPL
jgi:serine/threonine-protein phosphatase 6 regulatory subunit 3